MHSRPASVYRLTVLVAAVPVIALAALAGCTPAPRYTSKTSSSLGSEPQTRGSQPSKSKPGSTRQSPRSDEEHVSAGLGGESLDKPAANGPDNEVNQVSEGYTEIGFASYYGYDCAGNKTANGEKFNPRGLTAAHRTLPFNTLVRVTNLSNNMSVVVRVNDRGPHARNRIIDLAYGAAKQIDLVAAGHEKVKLEVVTQP